MTNFIYLADDTTLLGRAYKHALAKRLEEDNLSRMGGFIFVMSHILDHHDADGKIINEHGAAIHIHPDIVEEAYGWGVHFSWHTEIRREFANRMPTRRSQNKHLLRFQLWDAAYKINERPILAE